jgi:hypothetical protein
MLGFAGIGHTVETTAKFKDAAAVSQRIQRVGVHSACDEIPGAQRAALFAKGIECRVEIPSLHNG